MKFDKNVSLVLFRSLRADWLLEIAKAEAKQEARRADYYEDLLLHTDRMIAWLEGK